MLRKVQTAFVMVLAVAASIAIGRPATAADGVVVKVGPSLFKGRGSTFLAESSNPGANLSAPVETFDGKQKGGRLTVESAPFALAGQSFRVAGFYERLAGSQTAGCTQTAANLCTLSTLYDDADGTDQTLDTSGLGTPASVKTKRATNQVGVGMDWVAPPVLAPSPSTGLGWSVTYSLGMHYRAMLQRTTLVGDVVRANLAYAEHLNTHYLTGEAAIDADYRPVPGWLLGFGARFGAGKARTTYTGALNASSPSVASYNYHQKLSLHNTESAFTGTLSLKAERLLGWGTVGLYGQAEWLSYAPYMKYADNDVDDGTGPNKQTAFASDTALGYNVGVRLSVLF